MGSARVSRATGRQFAARFSKKENMTGKVKWFDAARGFGWIIPDDGSPEIFVHYSEIRSGGFRTLETGQAVEYKTAASDKGNGIKAVNVVPLQ